VVRARIALRKEGIIPLSSTDPNAEDTLIQAEVKAIRKKGGKNVTEDDVIAAFSRGDEVSLLIFPHFAQLTHSFYLRPWISSG
jgi:hypothetical protein